MPLSGRTVLRLRTHGSVYHLAVLHGENAARLAVVQGSSECVEGVVEGQSADPRIGSRSLWDVAVPGWIGQRLIVGTVTTAPIEGVAREMDAERAEAFASAIHGIARRLGADVDPKGASTGTTHTAAWSAEVAIVELELAALHLAGPTVQRLATVASADAAFSARTRGAIERARRALAQLDAALAPRS